MKSLTNKSLTISESIENIELYINDDLNNKKNNVLKNRNNNLYNKNKLVKNSLSMPNLFLPKSEKGIKHAIKSNDFHNYLHPKERIPLKKLEIKVHKHFINNYIDNNYYNIKKIDEIVNNEKSHLVAKFKDFLILGDIAEFLQKFYTFKETQELYSEIIEY